MSRRSPSGASGDGRAPTKLRVESWNFRDQAVDILREQILEGRYEPGGRLNEVEIAEAMGMSRGPLREALQRLVAEGLVEVVPHRGAFVRNFSPPELEHMYEFRVIVEAAAARLAAVRATEKDVAGLRTMLGDTDRLLGASPDAGYPASPDFHRRILELSGNPILLRAGTELQTQVRIARRSSGRTPGRARGALMEHLEIVEAIAHRDSGAANDAMVRHLNHSLATFVLTHGGTDEPLQIATRGD